MAAGWGVGEFGVGLLSKDGKSAARGFDEVLSGWLVLCFNLVVKSGVGHFVGIFDAGLML